MEKKCYLLLSCFIFLLNCGDIFSQARISIGSDYVVFNGGTSFDPVYLTINNSSSDAITKTSTGFIISDNEYQVINWYVGENNGLYVFPFGNSGVYTPIELNVKTTGVGTGLITASTWCSEGNIDLPDGGYSLCIDENDVVDRFWNINYSNYSLNPVADVRIHYNIGELDGNQESGLQAQRGDKSLSCPWESGKGTANDVDDYVEIANVTKGGAWILSSKLSSLPVEMLSFNAFWSFENYDEVAIEWETASEVNNDYFEIQRSVDGYNFQAIGVRDGNGNTKDINSYHFFDLNPPKGTIIYYRIKQFDFDGTSNVSEIIALESKCASIEVSVYPNPSNEFYNISLISLKEDFYSIFLYDIAGREVYSYNQIYHSKTTNHLIDASILPEGTYVMHVKSPTQGTINSQILIKTN